MKFLDFAVPRVETFLFIIYNVPFFQDAEVQRNCFQNVLMAYLELVLTFPLERFHVIHPVLQGGFLQLAKTVADPQLLDRINLFFDKKDLSSSNYK